MAHSGNAGGPPGTHLAGPIHTSTNLADAAGAFRARGPLYLTTNATESVGHVAGLTAHLFSVMADDYQTIGAGSITNTMQVGGGGDFDVMKITMPYAGVVVALSANAENGVAANSVTTISPRIAGTRKSFDLSLTNTTSHIYKATGNYASMTFSAGDELEIVYGGNTTNAGKDISAILWTL